MPDDDISAEQVNQLLLQFRPCINMVNIGTDDIIIRIGDSHIPDREPFGFFHLCIMVIYQQIQEAGNRPGIVIRALDAVQQESKLALAGHMLFVVEAYFIVENAPTED